MADKFYVIPANYNIKKKNVSKHIDCTIKNLFTVTTKVITIYIGSAKLYNRKFFLPAKMILHFPY